MERAYASILTLPALALYSTFLVVGDGKKRKILLTKSTSHIFLGSLSLMHKGDTHLELDYAWQTPHWRYVPIPLGIAKFHIVAGEGRLQYYSKQPSHPSRSTS